MEIKNYPEISQDALNDTLVIDQGTKTTFMQFKTLNANPPKWSNTLKTVRRQFANELFVCVRPFCGIGA